MGEEQNVFVHLFGFSMFLTYRSASMVWLRVRASNSLLVTGHPFWSTPPNGAHITAFMLCCLQNKTKQNFYCASMLYAGRQRSVLNCISSEYQVNHGALFITPEPALCDEHGERSSLPGKGKDEAGWQQHHQAKNHVGLEQTGLFLPYMISYLQPSASNCFHQSLFP